MAPGHQPLGQAGSAISLPLPTPTGPTTHLTLDPDRLDTFIHHMEQALAKLRDAHDNGLWLVQVEPPGDDPFSPQAVEDIQRTAGEEPGGHLYANRRAQEVFEAIIGGAKASLAAYRENEARGIARFRGEE